MQQRPHAGGIRHLDLAQLSLASSETVRRINRDIVLELIRNHQPTSRADLARISGLQRSTISQIVEQLISERWVREGAQASSARGRRPTLLGLNEDLLVIAADIRPQQATIATVDQRGRLLSRSVVPLSRDPVLSTELITACMERLIDEAAGKSIEGIGMSLPGRVDPISERLIFAPNLSWPEFDLKRAVEQKLKLPVRVENAATACLLAELTFRRMETSSDVVLVTISEGVGGGIVANGRFILGSHGMAGEFGHIALDASGPLCACGHRGCWEVFASCRAALRRYREVSLDTVDIRFSDLLHLAEEGNVHATDTVGEHARWIGRGLQAIIAALSPGSILVAGDITSAWHRYGPIIESCAAEATLAGPPPKVVPAYDGDLARLRGAAALIFQSRAAVHSQL